MILNLFRKKLPDGKHAFTMDHVALSNVDSGIQSSWKNQICGILCLKLSADILNKKIPDISQILEDGLKNQAYLEDIGWIHQKLVDLAKTIDNDNLESYLKN